MASILEGTVIKHIKKKTQIETNQSVELDKQTEKILRKLGFILTQCFQVEKREHVFNSNPAISGSLKLRTVQENFAQSNYTSVTWPNLPLCSKKKQKCKFIGKCE